MVTKEEIKQILNSNNSYKFITDKISFKSENTSEGRKFYVQGYISTNDIDIYNDLVTPHAMKSMLKQLQDENVTIDYEHEAWRDDNSILPVGRIIEARLDERGLWIRAILNKASPKFKALWSSIKEGFVKAFSIAFKPLKTILKTIGDMEVRVIEDLILINIAFTGAPVNKNALITDFDMKSVMLKAISNMERLESKGELVLVPRKMMEELKMEDDKIEKKDEAQESPAEESKEESTPDESKEEVKEEVKEEDKKEPEQKTEEKESPELKAMKELTEQMKSMTEKLDKQETELKSLKSSEIFKSATPEQAELKSESEMTGPKNVLDAIR